MRRIVSPLDGIRSPFGRRSGAVAFSPLALFAASEPGAWYDPSDLTTLYQDSAGTTPVTAVEQPVGLIRDKSGRGNHASQSTAASRPVLSARVNLLTYTEQFDNAAWTKTNATITQNDTTDPLGTSTADALVEDATLGNHMVKTPSSVGAAGEHTLSCCFKAGTRSWAVLNFNGQANAYAFYNLATGSVGTTGTGAVATVTDLGGGWYRCSLKFTLSAARAAEIQAASADGTSSYSGVASAKAVYIWGADLRVTNDGVGLPAYQRVGAATAGSSTAAGTGDYDTTGFPLYLRWDGTDDGMATSAIDFSATDKMSIFAGVRKLSDAAAGIVVELGANSNSTAQTFSLKTAFLSSAEYGTMFGGSVRVNTNTPTNYAAPITNVIFASSDISADSVAIRVNGASAATSASDQGTGNYANAVLNIGSRNASSQRLNGRLYSLIVLGRTATATEITNTETWVNGKTKAYA